MKQKFLKFCTSVKDKVVNASRRAKLMFSGAVATVLAPVKALAQELAGTGYINIELDKYTRAFDIIDLVYSTVSTGFNVYRTYDTVSDKIGKYKSLLSDFNDRIVKRGRFETADTLLLSVNMKAVSNIAKECENLYASVSVLAAYASGKICCTTASMMMMIENINRSLDRIKAIVNSAYFQTWKFIKARTSYWKGELYRSKTLREVANDAFGRWMESAGILDY